MNAASGDFGQMRYIPEATQGTTPTTGDGINLRVTNPTMKASVSSTKSNEMAAHRMSTGSTNTDLNVDGGFDFELSGGEFDPFISSSIYGAFSHYGTAGVGDTFSCTTATNSITAATAPTGSSAFTALANGSWFKLNPPASASAAVKAYFADKWFKVASTTATAITLDANTPISGAGLGITAVAGYSITQSVVSNGNTASFFTFEHEQADIGQFLWFKGMQTGSMSLSLEVGSMITGSFGFTGMSHDISSTSILPGTPAASKDREGMNAVTDVGMVLENGANLLNSGSFIKSVKLDINNNLRARKGVGVYGSVGIGSGELAVSGSLEVYFTDATYYRKWLDGTKTSLTIGMADSGGYGYLFEMDHVKFKDGGLSGLQKGNDVMLSLPFDAHYNAATGRGIRITRAVGI